MGFFDRDKNSATREDLSAVSKSIDSLTSSISKLADVTARLASLVQEQHAAVAELYMIQSQILGELTASASRKISVESSTSVHKKSSKMN